MHQKYQFIKIRLKMVNNDDNNNNDKMPGIFVSCSYSEIWANYLFVNKVNELYDFV